MKKITTLLLALLMMFSLAACGGSGDGGSNKDVDLSAVYTDISDKVTLPEMIPLDTDRLMSFYGIDKADVKQFVAYVSAVSVKVDEVVMFEAVDGEAAGRIKTALQTRYDSQYSANQNYLPDQAAIIQDCEVSQNGNYVRMFISPDADTMVSVYEEAFK